MAFSDQIYGVANVHEIDVGKYTKGDYANDPSIPKFFYCWQFYIVKKNFDDKHNTLATTILKSIVKKITDVASACEQSCTIDLRKDVLESPEIKKVIKTIPAPIPELDTHVLVVFSQTIKTILKDIGFTCETRLVDDAMNISLRWGTRSIFAPKTFIRMLPEDQQLIPSLREMLRKSELCDLTLKVKDREFKVHGLVLAAQSMMFRRMLLNPMKEGSSFEVTLDTTVKTAEQLLDLIYSSQTTLVDPTADDLLELIACAHLYGFTKIVNACERALTGFITVENVLDIYLFAKDRDVNITCDSCRHYFSGHPEAKDHAFVLSYTQEQLDVIEAFAKTCVLKTLQAQIAAEKQNRKRKAEDEPESDRVAKKAKT